MSLPQHQHGCRKVLLSPSTSPSIRPRNYPRQDGRTVGGLSSARTVLLVASADFPDASVSGPDRLRTSLCLVAGGLSGKDSDRSNQRVAFAIWHLALGACFADNNDGCEREDRQAVGALNLGANDRKRDQLFPAIHPLPPLRAAPAAHPCTPLLPVYESVIVGPEP